jgi:hypothetical protein
LVYGYSTGVFSSRKLEMATYDSVAFRYIAAGSHPDQDTLASVRRRFIDELSGLFVQVLELAAEMKLLKLGTVCLDGTKIHANASRHSALSHGHIVKLEAQLKQEVQALLAMAETADTANLPDGMSLPKELKLCEERLAAMAQAKTKIAACAAERYAREKAEYDEKLRPREDRAKDSGRRPGGKPPTAPRGGVRDSDQINLTDEESRIMPVAGGGFKQCYNAQAAVDAETMLVVATTLTQAPNDKQQVQPMLKVLQEQSPMLGNVEMLVADTGYCSQKNVAAIEEAGMVPLIAMGRVEHHPDWSERFAEPAAVQAGATPMQAMAHRLATHATHATHAGRAVYALRKQTVEPVFRVITSVMAFRQFSLRGIRKTSGEWNLVCLAWDIKRMAVLRLKIG